MLPTLLHLIALLTMSLALVAEDMVALTVADTTVVPGKRVGLISQYSSLSTLQALYGGNSIRCCQLDAGEGELIAGAKLFEGTDRALDIVWAEDGIEKRIASIRIIGRAWVFNGGLKLGMTLAEVEKVNGAAFKVAGFDWDGAGYATFEGGRLAGGVILRFRPTEKNYSADARGDVRLMSDNPALETAHPVVESITVTFCGAEAIR